MAADLSRVRHHPLLDYAGVELKQGAVLLDADANELVAILDRRLRALASDVLGRSTVSQTTPDAFRLTVLAGALRIGRGRLYVDGLLAENHGSGGADFDPLLAEPTRSTSTPLTAQPYLPVPLQPPTGGRQLVYLDVWQRVVTHLEDPALVETAVGVETSSRLQTVWQVRLLGGVGADAACGSELEAWNALTAPSSGRLSSGTFDVPPASDPCELPPTGGYRGLENQLYRVEIHDAGQPGGDATFKWSRENASVGSRVASVISATELELDSLGRDEVLGIADGDWIEITDDHREFALQAGEMRRVSLANPDTRRITLNAALPGPMLPGSFPDGTLAATRNLRVRRWDQRGPVFRTGSDVPIQNLDDITSTGVIRVPAAGTTVLLENGVTASFASTGAPGFKTGDYWVFAARTSDATVEELDNAPPRGVHHHYARLGLWDVAAGAVTDCRTPWPPRGDEGDCGCTECVTPESHASGQLTIQAAVDRVRDSGGTVCLHAGVYPLREPVRVAGARSLAIRGQGAASVITAPGTAFQIEGAAGLVIEKLSVLSIGAQSAITARTVAGLRLSELVLVVIGANDGNGAGIGLQGLCAGVAIHDNLIVAPDGVRSEGSPGQRSPLALTAAMQVRDNVLWCRRRGVSLEGRVAHLSGHRIENNEVLGCRDGGLAALGLALPGASMRICGNTLSVNGPGIECGVDGAWIEGNKLNATSQAERAAVGSAIVLATGLDPTGSDQAQVLANQISGFADAGVLISAPVRDLICKFNIVENCGAGIVMGDDAEASAVSIENNHIRDIRGTGTLAAAGLAVGIGVARAAAATVAGNQVRRVALAVTNARFLAGIFMLGVERSRIHGNEIGEIGPVGDFSGIGVGILVTTPYAECDVARNQVERDAEPQASPGESAWAALLVADGSLFGSANLGTSTTGTGNVNTVATGAAINRTANTTTVRVDDRRTLVMSGNRATISTARNDFIGSVAAGTIAGAAAAAVQGGAASVQGNTFAARGRAPAVFVVASAEALFSDNRCTHQGSRGLPAVLLNTPVALVNANRVRSGDLSIAIAGSKTFTALGNITSGVVRVNNSPLPAPWAALNVIG
jgi:Family of unknown function (DUF6519)/Right handed beta helix region